MKMDNPPVVGDIGAKIYLPDIVAASVVVAGNGVYVDGDDHDLPDRLTHDLPGTLTHVGEETSQPEPEPEGESSEPPKRPYTNAPKSAWVEYASHPATPKNISAERAEGMTKVDLISRYDERL